MNTKVVFGQYYNSNSWIHRLDPRTKLISLIVLMVSLFLVNSIYVLLGSLLLTIVLVSTSKVPMDKFLGSLKMMVMLLIFTTLFQVVFNKTGDFINTYHFEMNLVTLGIVIAIIAVYFLLGKVSKKFRTLELLIALVIAFWVQSDKISTQFNAPLLFSYDVSLYTGGVYGSLRVIIRIVTLLILSSLLTLTTKPTELNNGLEKLLSFLRVFKLNISVFTMMISIALRFIPTLINEADKILKAQASRGVDFNEGTFKEKVSQIVSLLIPMFVISYKKADDLASAMEARGYDPDGRRTSINVLEIKISDIICLVFSFLILGAFIYMKVAYAL